jgi:hypothetical protein
MRLIFIALFAFIGVVHADDAAAVRKYWSQGKGEITHYALTQARYGELHSGSAVLVFVTEPFSKSKQVKLDDWQHAGDDLLHVLKLNFTKNFVTGVYPYSLMLSVFTPLDGAKTVKTTMSGQEWCGHVFSQLNLRGDSYDYAGYSYFETEGDVQSKLPARLLEDELWTRLRINPESLPIGDTEMIPGAFISRLMHHPLKSEKARTAIIEADSTRHDPALIRGYRVKYTTGKPRTLDIFFERAAPHRIVGWRETYEDFGGKTLTTEAHAVAEALLPYWQHHGNADRPLREQLKLPVDQ